MPDSSAQLEGKVFLFMKLTKRKGFNFFRSYYDVFNELPEKDKLPFIEAVFDRQFLGIKPTNLKGMAKFAYISQTNSIDSQVKGFEDKTGIILNPTEPPTEGGVSTPSLQVEVEGKVEGKREVKVFTPPSISEVKEYFKEKGYSEQSAIKAFDYYDVADWKDSKGNKVKNWKQKMQGVWFKEENKTKKTSSKNSHLFMS